MKVRNPKSLSGAVARDAAAGKRPFLTVTIDPNAFLALDSLAAAAGLSRGRMIDRLVADAVQANVDAATDLAAGYPDLETDAAAE